MSFISLIFSGWQLALLTIALLAPVMLSFLDVIPLVLGRLQQYDVSQLGLGYATATLKESVAAV